MKKILVADDEMAIRLLVRETLFEYGYEKVYMASDGREALEILEREENIDLVILDIKMRKMDGIEALRQIRERYQNDITVIIYTAYGEYRQDYALWAADEYIVKSSDLLDLVLTVKKYCPQA